MADGLIDPQRRNILRSIGQWMSVNSQSMMARTKRRQRRFYLLLATILLLGIECLCGVCRAGGQSEWVYFDSRGKLTYRTLPTGDCIMDFSYAGYGGGGVAIPDVPAKIIVRPGGDDSAIIQKAIDDLSQMSLIDGHRGTVQLTAGIFNCARTLNVNASGVVLRGSDGTILHLTGSPHVAIVVSGKKVISPDGRSTAITDAYVPSAADSFNVGNAAGLGVGDTVQIIRPVTKAWVDFMGMSDLVRNDKEQRWLSGKLETERTIQSISGNRITVTVPLSDSYDSQYLSPPGTTVVKVKVSGLISQVGIEHLRIECPPQAINIADPQFQALHLEDVVDSWARDLEIVDTIDSIDVGAGSSRVTIQRVNVRHSVATLGAAKPGDFGANGTQTLFDRCSSVGNNLFYAVTLGRVQGPNVLLNCSFQGNGHVQPHMRWSTGLLVDNCRTPEGGIDLMNRGIMGSGHGWTMGWGVVWNCIAKSFLIQQPPGAMNWAIGCKGAPLSESMPGGSAEKLPNGVFDSPDVPVAPASLYLEQLRERLGPQAVKNIGY
jgi:hypothetical protein